MRLPCNTTVPWWLSLGSKVQFGGSMGVATSPATLLLDWSCPEVCEPVHNSGERGNEIQTLCTRERYFRQSQ